MISIIVPVYNVEACLPRCLESLTGQTCRDLEIICVNDGSTDGSLRILQDAAAKDGRIRVVDRANKGVSASRNEALDAARGEWVMFVDSDDWIDAGTCQSALVTAEKHQADVVMWAYCREYANQSLPKLYLNEGKIWEDDITDLHRRMVGPVGDELGRPDTMDAWGTIWGKLYRRALMEAAAPIRFTDTRQVGSAEDVLFNIAYMARVRKAVYVPQAWYHYRKGTASFTSVHKADLPRKWDTLYACMEKELDGQGKLRDDFLAACRNRISLGIIGLGLNEMFADTPFGTKCRRIGGLLDRPVYRQAVATLSLGPLPLHWKVFFLCAKYRFAPGVAALLAVIRNIINR